jgi:hypothetical protein
VSHSSSTLRPTPFRELGPAITDKVFGVFCGDIDGFVFRGIQMPSRLRNASDLRLPPFGEEVPMPRARPTLLFLGQRQQVEASEKRGKAGQVAIVVRVRLGIAAADESVGRDGPAG